MNWGDLRPAPDWIGIGISMVQPCHPHRHQKRRLWLGAVVPNDHPCFGEGLGKGQASDLSRMSTGRERPR